MSHRRIQREESQTHTPPKYTQKDFTDIGWEQRGDAEAAMLDVQRAMGGGVLSVLVEHAGDLIHRANDENTFSYAGYPYVKDKVDKLLRLLRHSYGFEKEYRENVASNARYHGVDRVEKQKEIDKALLAYAREHNKLRALNDAHRTMKKIADAIGHQNFWTAEKMLAKLDEHLGSEEEWKRYAHEGLIEEDQ